MLWHDKISYFFSWFFPYTSNNTSWEEFLEKKQNFPIKKSPTDLICKRRIYSVVPLFLKTIVFHSTRVTNAYESAYLFRPSAKCVPQTSSRMHFHHHPNKNAFSRWRLLSVILIMMYSFRSSLLYYLEIILKLEYEIDRLLSSSKI